MSRLALYKLYLLARTRGVQADGSAIVHLLDFLNDQAAIETAERLRDGGPAELWSDEGLVKAFAPE